VRQSHYAANQIVLIILCLQQYKKLLWQFEPLAMTQNSLAIELSFARYGNQQHHEPMIQ
jgi:hypothetical protein